jgi:hypothetical protein
MPASVMHAALRAATITCCSKAGSACASTSQQGPTAAHTLTCLSGKSCLHVLQVLLGVSQGRPKGVCCHSLVEGA